MITLKKDLKDYWYAIIIVIIYMISMQLIFNSVCPLKILFNIDCPGCGLTRATISLLRGDLQQTLHYNYACIFWFITILLFLIDRYIKPLKIKPFPTLFIITCLITIIRYILIVIFKTPLF